MSLFPRLLLLAAVFVSGLAAESAGGLSWTAPSDWEQQQRPMRAANYVIPAVEGDSEPGELAVYYFGPGQGGSVDANINRWLGQFQSAAGQPLAMSDAERTNKTVNGVDVTLLDVSGTYLFKPFPMAPQATPKPGYRMLAVIAEGADAPVFFKLTAPAKTAAAAEAEFHDLIDNLRRQ